ncbi:MAG: hypothetical protein IJJ22_00335 [Oscillospiraceae bacterium]|nr:hypothetical protein [Oscillospiraceae bacterium]
MIAFGAIKYLLAGILCIVLGLATWRKHRLSLVHNADYSAVKPEHIIAYTSLVGFGVTLIGIGICLTGMLSFVTRSFLMRLPACAGIIAGFIFINKAQREYNG